MNRIFVNRKLLFIVLIVVLASAVTAQHKWANQIGGSTTTNSGNAVTTDKFGNVYVTGAFSGSNIDFGNGKIVSSSPSVYGNTDFFIAAYTRNGICKWVRNIPGAHTYGGVFGGKAIAADRYGNVVVCGQLDGLARNWGDSVYTGINSGGFVACFDTSGKTQWVQTMIDSARTGALNVVTPNSITLDAAGNIYVAGTFLGSVIIGQSLVYGDPNNVNMFLAKYSSAGIGLWTKSNIVSRMSVVFGTIATSVYWSPDNQIYVSGVYGGVRLNFGGSFVAPKDSLNLHIFTVRYSYTGSVNLLTYTTGSGAFYSASSISAMSNPSDYSFYISTYTTIGPGAVINFGNGFTASYDPAYQGQYAFLIKKDLLGNTLWVKTMKTSFTTFLADNLSVDAGNNVYLSGLFSGAMPVNFGGATYSPQGADLVTAKFNPLGEGTLVHTSQGSTYVQPKGIALDDSARITATGVFRGQQTFPPFAPFNSQSSSVFICKSTASGQFLSAGDSLKVWLEDRTVTKNDTANIAVYFKPVASVQAGSFEIKIKVDGTRMTVSGIDTAGTLTGKYKWLNQIKISGDTLRIALYGVSTIVEEGVLFRINSYIRSTASGNIPVIIDTAVVNTGAFRTYTKNGLLRVNTGVQVRQQDKSVPEVRLLRNYPNPFSAGTTVSFSTSVNADISLTLHSLTGATVKVITSGFFTPGMYSFPLEVKELGSGTYYLVLKTNTTKDVKKLILVK